MPYTVNDTTHALSYYVDLRLGTVGHGVAMPEAYRATAEKFGPDAARRARLLCGEEPKEKDHRDRG